MALLSKPFQLRRRAPLRNLGGDRRHRPGFSCMASRAARLNPHLL